MGGYWAYKTLGWGGYWGWDPVENASLIPWLFGTVLIHGLHLERTKGRYRRANYVLAALVYLVGALRHVPHPLGRARRLLGAQLRRPRHLGLADRADGVLRGSVALPAGHPAARQVPTAPNEDPLLSRGTFMVLSTITILRLRRWSITVGTSAPLLTRFMENPGQVGPAFYNQVNLPIALLIALLLSLVPYLTWRATTAREILRKLIGPRRLRRWRSRSPRRSGRCASRSTCSSSSSPPGARHQPAQDRRQDAQRAACGGAGGYLAHVGVGVILLGILASSAYDESTKVTLEQGEPHEGGGH